MLRLLEHDELRLLYLDRYWREEEQVHADLRRPAGRLGRRPTRRWLAGALDRVFPAEGYDEQRAAARVALTHATTVLTGGPGTGKTTTVAALLALCAEQAELAGRPGGADRAGRADRQGRGPAPAGGRGRRSPGCPAPTRPGWPASARSPCTGCSAARPDTSSRFRHHRDNRLPHDVVVVDETSMVSLTMMARLLEAVRPGSRLILVGDPFQLASVEAGAVLADLVDDGRRRRPRSASPRSLTSHRFGESIGALAEAVRARRRRPGRRAARGRRRARRAGRRRRPGARASAALVAARTPLGVLRAAEAGDADRALELLDRQRLLCAHREGPYGVRHWNTQVERWLGEETGEPI